MRDSTFALFFSASTAAQIFEIAYPARSEFFRRELKSAKGVLVFAGVIKAGFGIGGEYGEGALRTHGKTAGYYSIGATSIGFQLGVQKKDVILIFI